MTASLCTKQLTLHNPGVALGPEKKEAGWAFIFRKRVREHLV